MDKTSWNKAKAARLLGIDRVTLYRKIKRHNLTEDTHRL
ncbi:MAG: helix-turn-helix domain-containing protein [Syntrophobacteraceae bacterium]